MRAAILLILCGVLLMGCGQTPHPFSHDSALIKEPLPPLSIAEIEGLPGLADALIAGFDKEDIPATKVLAGGAFFLLSGQIEKGNGRAVLHWRITDGKGRDQGGFDQAYAPTAPVAEIAAAAVDGVSHLMRADDLGVSDLAARPKVKIGAVTVTGGFLDADQLKRTLISALEHQSIAVVTADAPFLVSGAVRITHGLAGHELVEVTWVVADDKNVEIGKVNQGNPTLREELLSQATQITRQIAEGGADGIAQLVKLKPKATTK
jgi:hypothetical protein